MSKFCSNCGNEIDNNAVICVKCGVSTNNVINTPNAHTPDDFKNLDNLSICILSDICDIIPNAVETNTNVIITFVIKFPTSVIINTIIGCNIVADTIFPCCYH